MNPNYITNDPNNYATLDAEHLQGKLMAVIFDNLFTIRSSEPPHSSAEVLERIMLSAEMNNGDTNEMSIVFDLGANNYETDHPKVIKKYKLTLTEDDDPNFDKDYYEATDDDDDCDEL